MKTTIISAISALLIKTTGAVIIVALTAPLVWGGVDVYLVYSGSNKAQKTAVMDALPKGIKVKAYNADLLAVADYSGIQKAVAKFDNAEAIIILQDRPMEMLRGATVNKDLYIVESLKTGLASSRWKVYLLKKGADLSSFGDFVREKHITSIDDLSDPKAVRASDVLLVDERTLKVQKVLSYLVGKSLNP